MSTNGKNVRITIRGVTKLLIIKEFVRFCVAIVGNM